MPTTGLAAASRGNCLGKKTAVAGTVINQLVPPRKSQITRVNRLVVTAAGTAHVLTLARSLGRTWATATGASGQAVVNVAADPALASGNTTAANDWLAIRETDGVTRLYQVQSVSGLAFTLTANLVAGVAASLGQGIGDVWYFGVMTYTDPITGNPQPQFNVPASATTTWTDNVSGLAASNHVDEPLLIQDNNITAAGTIEQIGYAYTPS